MAVVGSLNLDLTALVTRAPDDGETVLGRSLSTHPGGKGANQAIGSARLAPTAIIGAVGHDDAAHVLRAAQRSAGVDTRHLTDLDAATGRAIVVLAEDGSNRIIVIGGANGLLDPEYVTEALDELDPAVVLTQLELPPPVTHAVASWARARQRRFVLNPSPTAPVAPEILQVADPLVVNEHEAEYYANTDPGTDIDRVMARLLGRVSAVVVTRGGDDIVIGTKDGIERIPVPHVAVIDTTGAGDHFAGTLAALLGTGVSLRDAVVRAGADAAKLVATRREDR
ncbi:ribokinase [Rhodococcus artemisiae]|uniref:Ribokinase n=1 Tax=Rhodococcus artemisiae TaxID=714159 RepID=A0ABU7LCN2_9NOCA|nr:ribokinase [Rhodococcus artemisiae]MEE2059275.1 ribokinase [Rhodococcus artemisiae]